MSIDLQPEILKSGADSSMTLKILLRREVQWCHKAWTWVFPAAKQVIDVLKGLVAKIEQDEEYRKLKVSVWNTPWMPIDEDAQANRVNQLTMSGVLSKRAGRSELNVQYNDDDKQIALEQEEKIYRETYVKLKAEAQARKDFGVLDTANDVKPDASKVDNRLPYKP